MHLLFVFDLEIDDSIPLDEIVVDAEINVLELAGGFEFF